MDSDQQRVEKWKQWFRWSLNYAGCLEDCVRIMAKKQQEDAWKILKIIEEK